ncbi:MAG TPA: cyclase family protein [Gemmatimonadales bacterium]|nr:cyclase family protein [Gemmatimonadales bacterium]
MARALFSRNRLELTSSRFLLGLVAVIGPAVAACDRDEADELSEAFSEARWVDLSYAFNAQTIYWPTAEGFKLDTVAAGMTPAGYYYAANNLRTSEHGGTHLDAPIHFAEGRNTTDRIPLEQLVGPAVVVDVSASASANPDYLVSVADLEAFERDHGRIPGGAIVLFRTGWGSRWPDRARYLGTARTGPEAVPLLHFPGIDSSAARWLVTNRRVDAVGIDTPSIDYGQSTTFDTHRILYAADIPGFENVANLERVPVRGAYVIALPMKIEGGSGGPLRIVAVMPGS